MNWDYVAGFFDGEGSVTIRRTKSSQIRFGNTNRCVLLAIRDFLGVGKISQWDPPRGKRYYQLTLSNRLVSLWLAKNLIPRCIIKRRKLSQFVRFVERTHWKKTFRPYARPAHVTPEFLRRHYVRDRLSEREVAKLGRCDVATIHRRLHKFGIPIRTVGEGVANFYRRNPRVRDIQRPFTPLPNQA